MKTMQWSEVARTPREVAEAVDSAGQVRLERRGDIPFVIAREDRVREAEDAMESAARVIATIASTDHMLEKVVQQALPWSKFLPEKDLKEFSHEFAWTVEACADLKIWAPLGRLIEEWRETATIHADPVLAARLGRALDAGTGYRKATDR